MKRILVLAAVLFVALIAITSCKKEYSYERAAGTLRDSLNNCKPVEITGHYRKGASLASDSFFVTVEVNISKIGAYNISTDFINGFQFAGSGTFQQKGIQKVRLKAKGTPFRDTISVFNCSFDTSTCTFSIQVKTDITAPPVIVSPGAVSPGIANPPDSLEINSWYFYDLTDRSLHQGIIDESSNWSVVSPTEHFLNIVGWPGTPDNNNHDTIFTIQLFLASPQIETGTYPITAGFHGDNFFGYANNVYLPYGGAQSFFYFYRSTVRTNTDFTFTIISYDPLKHVVSGSFQGSSQRRKEYQDFVGNVHEIKGKFYFRLK